MAGANPEKVTELQRRVDALAREAVAPLILQEAFGTLKHVLFGSVAFPEDARALEIVP